MSRYVRVTVDVQTHEEVQRGLEALGVPFEADARRALMLEGSLECVGEPVTIRLAAGVLGTVEDFGFAQVDGSWRLVCGELDRELLEDSLLRPLLAEVARARVHVAAKRAGLTVERVEVEPGGEQRIVLKRE